MKRRQIALLCLLLKPMSLLAATNELHTPDLYEPGHGSITLDFQMIDVSHFNNGEADVDIGSVKTRSAYLEVEYAVASRWLLKFGIPYIVKSYNGPGRHDPLKLDPPRPEVPFLDDGRYHSDFQDFLFGLNYLVATEPFIFEPFVHASIPTHDYPHFAQAAVGQNLWRVEIGAEATRFQPFSNWYYRASASYTVVQKTLGVSVNHFRLNGELGYFLSPSFMAHVFVNGKFGRGDDGTDFPPSQRTDERWYQHDRTSRHSYCNAGVGANWYLGEKYQLSGSVFTTVWGKTVHLVDWAGTVGITRYF